MEWQQCLDKIKGEIALLDAHLIAKDIMFSRQHIFKFRDKLGRNLARILSEHPQKNHIPPMLQENGKIITL